MPERDVIYARKSSDEGDRQIKSIPDQLEHCRELAQRHGLIVAPEDEFQESKSAKTPGNRPVFDRLIDLVKKGQVRRIICWHPDRLARNGPEGGMITGLLDMGLLKDLKFCTFGFENNTAGKMMLGIMFVMSKEYSDRLSDNIKRGVTSNLKQGKSVGTYKWGYERNADGLYEAHPKLYAYVKKIWEMRLNGKTFEEILKWIRLVGCERVTKKGNVFKITKSTLTRMFEDPIYYGMLRQKGELINLKDVYPDFRPMVDYEDWQKIRAVGRSSVVFTKRQLPLRGGIVRCACGSPCVTDISNNYLYLVCQARSKCPTGRPRIRAKAIVDAVYESLKENFNPTTEQRKALHKSYAEHVKKQLKRGYEELKSKRKGLVEAKTSAEEKLHTLVMYAVGKTLDQTERRVYEQEKTRYQEIIDKCTTDIVRCEKAYGLRDFDYDEFSNFLKTAAASWKVAYGDTIHHMASFLYLKITVNAGKVENLQYNREIEDLFIPQVPDGGAEGTQTPGLYNANVALYHLSYSPLFVGSVEGIRTAEKLTLSTFLVMLVSRSVAYRKTNQRINDSTISGLLKPHLGCYIECVTVAR